MKDCPNLSTRTWAAPVSILSIRRLALASIGLCVSLLPLAAAQINANFTAGNTSSQADGYVGTAGSGWTSAWTTNKGSATYITFSNTVTAASPLNSGGNYLSVNVSNSNTTTDYGGAVARQFDTAVVDNAQPYQLTFDFRGDANINQNASDTNSQYAIFGSTAGAASVIDANTTWAVAATYASGSVLWRYYNGSGTLVSTTVPYVSGSTYRFTVNVDPAAHTYSFSIVSGAITYNSPAGLGFRAVATGTNKLFFSAKDDKDHTGGVNFSVDGIALGTGGVTHEGWPEPVVPQINGAAMHLNTKIDFMMAANDPAMNQFRDAGYKFARFMIPWFDVERSFGQYNVNSPQSYIPGYAQFVELLKTKSVRPIICVGLGNSLYLTGTAGAPSDNGGIRTDTQRQGFRDFCFFLAKTFRDYDPIFEIWNEPNLSGFWQPTASASEYMAMVPYAIDGLKSGWHDGNPGGPDPLIVAPGVANSWANGNFIDQCFDLGLLDLVDGISFHPYFNGHADPAKRIPESLSLSTVIPAVKTELTARGKPNFPIVLTEWGWSTDPGPYGVSPDMQAKYAVRQVLMGYYTGITINCIYSMDDARNIDDPAVDKHYGLFTTTGADFQKVLAAKPAVAAVANLNSQLDGYRYVQKVNMGNTAPLNSAKDWCLVFWNPAATDYDGSAGNAKAVVWTTEFLNHTGPYQLSFDFRGDTNINQGASDTNSNYAIFGSVEDSASTLDANTTWGIGATYSGGSLAWRYYSGSSTLVSTGVPFVTGTTYHFVVNVDPVAHTYSFSINSGTSTYNSPAGLGFRNTGTGTSQFYFSARDDKDHTGVVSFSVDNIAIQLSGGTPPPPLGPVANFTDGNSSTAVDGYAGAAGNRWATAWTTNKGSATYVTFSNTVTATSPLNSGGNRLSVSVSNSGTAADYAGAVTRTFDTITGVQKTSPNLQTLITLDHAASTTFTDNPVIIDLDGYTPP